MLDLDIKEYLSQAGIRRIHELDTALIETFGQDEGEKHIERMTKLYDQSENRLIYGAEDTPYLHRQQELVDYLNQSLQMSLLAVVPCMRMSSGERSAKNQIRCRCLSRSKPNAIAHMQKSLRRASSPAGILSVWSATRRTMLMPVCAAH